MKNRFLLFSSALLLITFAWPMYGQASITRANSFLVGVAIEEISPTKKQVDGGDIFQGGYGFLGNRGSASGIHDPIWARSMTIQQAEKLLILVSIDAIGISNILINLIKKQVYQVIPVKNDQILISATHTHSGPDLQGLWNGVTSDYKKLLIKKVKSAIIKSYKKREEARLFISKTKAITENRRGWPFVDDETIALNIYKKGSGHRLATLINFGVHPTIVGSQNLLISSGFVHFLRKHVESHTGVPALFFNGALGDVKPVTKETDFAGAKSYGEKMGKLVLKAFANEREILPELLFNTRWIQVEVENLQFMAALLLGILEYETQVEWSFKGFTVSIQTPVSYLRLGKSLQCISLPGESLSRLAISIKNKMKAPFKCILGMTNNTLGYLIPADEWESGRNKDYEESVSMGKKIGDQLRDIAINLVAEDKILLKK